VAPVLGDDGEALLAEAIREHQQNIYGDFPAQEDRNLPFWERIAVATFRPQIEASALPMFVQVGWPDAATTEGTFERFATFSNPQDVWIGPWRHTGNQIVDYARPDAELSYADLDAESQFERLRTFFETHLRSSDTKTGQNSAPKTLRLATNGKDGWIETTQWPLPGTTNKSLFLGNGAKLLSSEQQAQTIVLPTAPHTTGTANRWTTNVGIAGPQDYSKWSDSAAARAAFTTDSLTVDMHILGFVVVSVDVTSSEADGTLFAYLEQVTPTGEVRYLTEGMLRLSHRGKTQPEARTDQRLDRSFATEGRFPMVPGEPSSVVFQLVPTSTFFEAGSRIQLSFATSDTGNFARYASPIAKLSIAPTKGVPALLIPVAPST
jgi:uncharacterized protein